MSSTVAQSTIIRYKASAPHAKYLGIYLRAFTDNLRADVVQPILEKYNIKEINPAEWMDAQVQLDMLYDIETHCKLEELVAVGMKAGELFPLPPEIDTLDKFLELSPQMYQMGLRDTSPEEQVRVEYLDIRHYRLIFNLPFPPFVMYGTTYSVLKRVSRHNQYPIITVLETGTPFIFDIRW